MPSTDGLTSSLRPWWRCCWSSCLSTHWSSWCAHSERSFNRECTHVSHWVDASYWHNILCIRYQVSQGNTGSVSIHCGVGTSAIPESVPHTVVPYHIITHGLGGSPRHHSSVTASYSKGHTCWRFGLCRENNIQTRPCGKALVQHPAIFFHVLH